MYRIVFCFFFSFPAFVFAQFDKANKLFQEKRFAAAIPYYEKALQSNNSIVAQSRLAFCYRMLNQTEKAETLYAVVTANEKARNETYFYYAEALMSNGKYKEAKNWFQQYHALQPDDSLALQRATACDLVPGIKPYFQGIKVEEFNQNSEADDNTPAFWRGGIVFTSDRAGGTALLKKKSDWTGRDFLKLWFSRYEPEKGVFLDPVPFSGKLNDLNKNTANASFTADWNSVFFSRNGNNSNRKNDVTLQLYAAERGGGRWKNEHRLDFCNLEQNYMHPAIAADGNTLFFASIGGGEGGYDIFMAQKNAAGEWRRVKNLGPIVNTPAHEAFPYFHHDGRLFFCSKGHTGFGGFDVFVTRLDSTTGLWAKPQNLGRPINSSLDDIGFYLAANDSIGCFSSGRSGGDDDLYLYWLGESKGFAQIFYPGAKNGTQGDDIEEDDFGPKSATETSSAPTDDHVNQMPSNAIPMQAVKTLDDFDADLTAGIIQIDNVYRLEGIQYDSISAVALPLGAKADIDHLARLLQKSPNLILEIGAHTESLGKGKYNQTISQTRAELIVEQLVLKGIARNRLVPKGYGEKKLLNECKDNVDCPESKHFANRRVEVRVL